MWGRWEPLCSGGSCKGSSLCVSMTNQVKNKDEDFVLVIVAVLLELHPQTFCFWLSFVVGFVCFR
jgi:hypothetical protein